MKKSYYISGYSNRVFQYKMLYEIYYKFIKDNWQLYALLLLTLVSLPMQRLAMPHYYGKIIDVLKSGDMPQAKYLFGVILVIWIAIQALGIILAHINKIIWPRMNTYVRQTFFDLIVDRYNQEYQDIKTGEIQSKLHDLPYVLDDVYNQFQKFLFNNSIVIISTFVYLYNFHHYLAIIYGLSIVSIVLLSLCFVNECRTNVKKTFESYDTYFEEVDDTLQNLLSIYTNKKIPDEKKRINKYGKRAENYLMKSNKCSSKYKIIYSILNIIIFIALNYTSYYLYETKVISSAVLISIFMINFSLLGDLISLYYDTKQFVDVKSQIDIISKFIDDLPKMKTGQTKELGILKQVQIEFKNINYKHPSATSKIYNNLNLTLYPNQDVIIMGHIGSGKSTFAKMLVGLTKYDSGNIYINGLDSKEIIIDDIRQNMIYIPQHAVLMNRTLWENITYGLTPEEVKQVKENDIYARLEGLGMDALSKKFKEKMHKEVGKSGNQLSGGQKQVVWLLRCIYKKAPMLIVDEPTNGLDPTSKEQIINLLRYLKEKKTLIIITHDKDVLVLGDRVIEFKNGSIIKDEKINSM